MGVPKFYRKFIRPRYATSRRRDIPPNVSSLSFDMNHIAHKAAGVVWAYGDTNQKEEQEARKKLIGRMSDSELQSEFHQVVYTMLIEYTQRVRPKDTIIIAFDGVPPDAKIDQQRNRRYKSALLSSGRGFDTNRLSVGTPFMRSLEDYLNNKFELSGEHLKFAPRIIFSGTLSPGEGEHKIMDYFRDGTVSGEGNHVIYGGDADLFMLSMLSPVANQIVLYFETKTKQRDKFIVEEDLLDIQSLKEAISAELKTSTAVEDFVFILFLMGNDFVPGSSAFSDVNYLSHILQVYSDLGVNLVRGSDMAWDNVKTFFDYLAKLEPTLLADAAPRNLEVVHRSPVYEYATTIISGKKVEYKFNPTKFRNAWYSLALGGHGNTKVLGTNPFPITVERINSMIDNYLTTMSWIFRYYNLGISSVNFRHMYDYNYAPLVEDLVLFLNTKTPTGEVLDVEGQTLMKPAEALVAVTPPKSIGILPAAFHPLYSTDSPIVDFYPAGAIIEAYGKNNLDEGHAILPPVEYTRLASTVDGIRISAKDRKRYFEYEKDKEYKIDPIAFRSATFSQTSTPCQRGVCPRPQQTYSQRGRGRGRGRDEVPAPGRGRGREREEPSKPFVPPAPKPKKQIPLKERIELHDDDPEEKYYKLPQRERFKGAWSRGQRKLAIIEDYFFKNFNIPPDATVVYAGAAPGTHFNYIAEKFPRMTFHLYDPRDFRLWKNPRIHIHQQLFTDEDAEKWKDRGVVFLSDIRGDVKTTTAETEEEEEEIEEEVWDNMLMQQRWVEIMKPYKSLLKFRLPYIYGEKNVKVKYLDGTVIKQPFAPPTSTETRLVPYDDLRKKDWDANKYESQMFYHNKYLRRQGPGKPNFDTEVEKLTVGNVDWKRYLK